MAGPNLEVIRFGFYVFFPVAMMLKFGDPEWYDTYVVPYGKKIWPDFEKTHKPPHTSSEIHDELARLKSERLSARRRDRAAHAEVMPDASASLGAGAATGSSTGGVVDSLRSAGSSSGLDWDAARRAGSGQAGDGQGHLV